MIRGLIVRALVCGLLPAAMACGTSSGGGGASDDDGGGGSSSGANDASASSGSGSGSGGTTSSSSGGKGSSGGSGGGKGSSSGSGSGSGSSGSSSGSAGDSGVPADESEWLDPMNAARAAVGEQPLTWDPIAAAVAKSWAGGCDWEHNPNASSEYDSMGGMNGLGENIAAGAPTQTVSAAVASWVDEKANYDHATNMCASGQVCGHYTQIVWSTTTAVGCAQVACTKGSPFQGFDDWDYSVCDFNPPGNIVGKSPY